MRKKDLIEKLKDVPDDATVFVMQTTTHAFSPVRRIVVESKRVMMSEGDVNGAGARTTHDITLES